MVWNWVWPTPVTCLKKAAKTVGVSESRSPPFTFCCLSNTSITHNPGHRDLHMLSENTAQNNLLTMRFTHQWAQKSMGRNSRHSLPSPCERIHSFKSFAGRLRILRFSYWVHFHPPLWFISCCRASTEPYTLHYHQRTDGTERSTSFLPDPDTAAANLKPCLAEIGFWKAASWLPLNLDKAEMMLISRGKCFEDLVKFVTAPSAEGICLASILRGVQCKHQVGIQLPPKREAPKFKENSLTFC